MHVLGREVLFSSIIMDRWPCCFSWAAFRANNARLQHIFHGVGDGRGSHPSSHEGLSANR